MDIRVETLRKEVCLDEYVKSYVDIERFAACCAECRGYGRTWACPPYDFYPKDIWQSYGTILLYGKKVILPEEAIAEEHEPKELAHIYNAMLKPIKKEMLNELFSMERVTPGSMALSAGGCDVCEVCTRPEGLPCRFPDKKRYSVESIGGDVLKSINDLLHEQVLWAENGHLPKHYILLGALLKK